MIVNLCIFNNSIICRKKKEKNSLRNFFPCFYILNCKTWQKFHNFFFFWKINKLNSNTPPQFFLNVLFLIFYILFFYIFFFFHFILNDWNPLIYCSNWTSQSDWKFAFDIVLLYFGWNLKYILFTGFYALYSAGIILDKLFFFF